jgi:hypothetical protein
MRLATARDEIAPQTDARVRQNPSYLTVILLERTVTRLGRLPAVDTFVVENLFASDLAFLQDLYRASTGRAAPRPRSPARPADTGSQSTWRVMSRGDPDVRGRPPLGGGRVRRLLPALVV